MKSILSVSKMLFSGLSHTAGAVAHVLGNIPLAVWPSDDRPMTEDEAKAKVAELRAKFGIRGVKLGNFDDDAESLRRDTLILGEDMRKAFGGLKDVK